MGPIILGCLALIYGLIFRFRKTSPLWRKVLRAILSVVALILSVPTLAYAIVGPIGVLIGACSQKSNHSRIGWKWWRSN